MVLITFSELQKFNSELSLPPSYRRRYPALGHLVFFNEKKINIFRLMHIALFLKVSYEIQILSSPPALGQMSNFFESAFHM